jgi:hypothetical protein
METNDEGENLLDFCLRNEMIVGNTWFRNFWILGL